MNGIYYVSRLLGLLGCLVMVLLNVSLADELNGFQKIKDVSSQSQHVTEYLRALTKDIGVRVSGTAAHVTACDWGILKFSEIGLVNVHRELCLYQPSIKPPDTGEQYDKPVENVVGDIIGSQFPDELVIVGAHIDSEDMGAGAEDNGSGVAATLEAARLLIRAGVKPKRTIRFILFGGEEAMLLGSRSYVDDHPELNDKISAMFTMDRGGRNPISGLQVTTFIKNQFSEIAEMLNTLNPKYHFSLTTIDSLSQNAYVSCGVGECSNINSPSVTQSDGRSSIQGQNTGRAQTEGKTSIAIGSSDHNPFLSAGIPAFLWQQEGLEPFLGHSKSDTFENVIPDVIQYSAEIIAITALSIADLKEMLSRKNMGTVTLNLSGCGK